LATRTPRTPSELRETRRFDHEIALALPERHELHPIVNGLTRGEQPIDRGLRRQRPRIEDPGARKDRREPLERVAEFALPKLRQ
jgi:hypothetical protein